MKMPQHHRQQHGAVSLFVVIFATLLMVIITLSFVQLMIKDQKQATASDLSQSAYDSAQSGVEDAKRLLLLNQQCDNGTSLGGVSCTEVDAAIGSDKCNTVSWGLSGNKLAPPESLIQQDEGDDKLQQAYTCVKIDTTTDDYRSDIGVNQSDVLPLRGTEEFTSIRISWFTRADLPTSDLTVEYPGSSSTSVELPRVGTRWDANNPPLMRAQLMQAGGNFTLADYDGEKNASTIFLYPTTSGYPNLNFTTVRRDASQKPELADCEATLVIKTYACSVVIDLPAPADGNTANRNAFLRLSALYNATHYKVELLRSDDSVVPFDNVQPEVDSTGRANDMFRRVKSRVELKGEFIYPEAAIDIEGDLCKSFIITNSDADYSNSVVCTP